MADPYPSGIVIEPFDASQHDRTAFSCGAEQVGNYFQKTANKLAKANNVRLYVMANRDGAVIGCYALNAHAVDYGELPVKFTRPPTITWQYPGGVYFHDRSRREIPGRWLWG